MKFWRNKVLLREIAKGVLTAMYPVHGWSCLGGGGRYPSGARRYPPGRNLGPVNGVPPGKDIGPVVGSIMEWRWGTPPFPVDRQTDACENITSAHPSDAVGKNNDSILCIIFNMN